MKYRLSGLDCPNCAAKIERELNKHNDLNEINVNFTDKSVELEPESEEIARDIINKTESSVDLIPLEQDIDNKENMKFVIADIKLELTKIVVSLILFVLGLLFRTQLQNTPYGVGELIVFMVPYFLVGSSVVWGAIKNLVKGQVFNEKFLMTVATGGAIIIGELPEAVAVMLFFAVGELFQDLAVNRSKRSISALLDLKPDYVTVIKEDSSVQSKPDDVSLGEIIEVKPGERVPLDGVILSGNSYVNTAALTGESIPQRVDSGDEVLAGAINENSLLRIKVTKAYKDSSVNKILDLIEQASAKKAPTEKFITIFARWYTPIVVGAALMLAFLPPIFITGATFSEWVYRALVLLVISCPCALVLSVPLSYFGGIGGASRNGILFKGANYLDALLKVRTVVFDKTGTLTKGVFKVVDTVNKNGYSETELLKVAALAEAHSNHPIASSIRKKAAELIGMCDHEFDKNGTMVKEQEEFKGYGIKSTLSDGRMVLVGNERLLRREGIYVHDYLSNDDEINGNGRMGSVVHVAVDDDYMGYLVVADEIKENASKVIKTLKKQGVENVIMLTGDDNQNARGAADRLGIDNYYAELLPADKLKIVDQLIGDNLKINHNKLAYIGDGINDAPVITRADLGIAMGALGSDAAIEASDVVIMDDNLEKIPKGIQAAHRTRNIVTQNIIFALGVKAVFVTLGALGLATMWTAVFADVGVALLAVLNSTRTLYLPKSSN